jgi:hypothetical protein
VVSDRPFFQPLHDLVRSVLDREIQWHPKILQSGAILAPSRNSVKSNGPFAETKEWIAGFDLLECDSMDEAVEIAGRHPMARFGRIEVRALWPMDQN